MMVSGRSFPTAEGDESMTNTVNLNVLVNVAWTRGLRFP